MSELNALIGTAPEDVTWWQMAIRAALIFAFAVLLFRLAPTRSFGKNAAFDVVLAVILGSMLSRTLTANAPLVPTLVGAVILVLLHLLVARLAFRLRWFGPVVKGSETRLVQDGEIDWKAMRRASITLHDLHEGLRAKAGVTDIKQVEAAYLERSGEISVICRQD